MDYYEIKWKRSAEKDIRKLKNVRIIRRIVETIESLIQNPYPVGCRKLRGTERLYRIRVGNFRIIYEVDHESKNIFIHYIRHRKDAYK